MTISFNHAKGWNHPKGLNAVQQHPLDTPQKPALPFSGFGKAEAPHNHPLAKAASEQTNITGFKGGIHE